MESLALVHLHGAHELPRLYMCLELRRHPWHSFTGLLGKTSDRRDTQRPWSALLYRDGDAASPTSARTARRRPEPERPRREGVLLVSLQGVIKRG